MLDEQYTAYNTTKFDIVKYRKRQEIAAAIFDNKSQIYKNGSNPFMMVLYLSEVNCFSAPFSVIK